MEAKAITDTLKTIRDYIRYAASEMLHEKVFFGHGTDNAWDEAVQLVLNAVHLPPDTDERVIDARLNMQERQLVINMINMRVKDRKPLPYITGTAYFGGLEFKVTPEVLIPRSTIAEVIEQGFQPWIQADKINSILDLCSGSGCIGILMALNYVKAKVDLVDISPNAIKISEQNVKDYDLQERLRCIESNLFNNINDKKYQIIISNPPYVADENIGKLPKEYSHEPRLALAAGEDGLDVVVNILAQASSFLTKDGFLIMEVGESKQNLINRFPKTPFTWLDFEKGGDGTFVLEQTHLKRLSHEIYSKKG